jgi:hypothetical protein
MTEAISPDSDYRPLRRPIAVRRGKREASIKTIGGAIQFMTSELSHLAATSEWQYAINALGVASEDYTPAHVDLATRYTEHVCSSAATLKP